MHQMSSDIVEHILVNFTKDELAYLDNCAFLISGGSGFVAEWIVSILYSILPNDSSPKIILVSRDPARLSLKYKKYQNLKVVTWQDLPIESVGEKAGDLIVIHASVPAASGESILATDINSYSTNTEILVETTLNEGLPIEFDEVRSVLFIEKQN